MARRSSKRERGVLLGGRGVLLAGAALLAALVVWEIGLRIFWHNPYVGELPDLILKVPVHHPNSQHVVERSHIYPDGEPSIFRTGARSYIEPSFVHEDPDATIAFMGGSVTAALATSEDQRFPALIAKQLGEHGLRVNSLNAARGGGSLHDSLNVLLNHIVRDRPDIVVVMNSGIDQSLLSGAGNYHARMGQIVTPGDMARWAMQMLSSDVYITALVRRNMSRGNTRTTRGFAMKSVEKEVPVEEFVARLRAFVGIARAFDSVPVLVTEPLVRYDTNHYLFNEKIREVGAEMGATVIDLANHIENETPDWNEPMNVFYDGIHVTENGSAIYAAYLGEHLLPVVRRVALERPSRDEDR
jgi:hypothetical protein